MAENTWVTGVISPYLFIHHMESGWRNFYLLVYHSTERNRHLILGATSHLQLNHTPQQLNSLNRKRSCNFKPKSRVFSKQETTFFFTCQLLHLGKYSNPKIPKVTIKHVVQSFANLRSNALSGFRVPNIDPQDILQQYNFEDRSICFWCILERSWWRSYLEFGCWCEYMTRRIGDEMLLSQFWL